MGTDWRVNTHACATIFNPARHWSAERLDGDGAGDARVDDGGRVRHDAAALAVPEQVHGGPQRPLDDAGHHEGHEPQRRPEHLAPARVAPRPALHAHRHERHRLLLLAAGAAVEVWIVMGGWMRRGSNLGRLFTHGESGVSLGEPRPAYIKASHRGRVAQRRGYVVRGEFVFAQFGRKDGDDSSTLWRATHRVGMDGTNLERTRVEGIFWNLRSTSSEDVSRGPSRPRLRSLKIEISRGPCGQWFYSVHKDFPTVVISVQET